MPCNPMVSPHDRAMRLVHRAQHSRVLLQVRPGNREFVLLHQPLLDTESLFHSLEQTRVKSIHFLFFASTQLVGQLPEPLMRLVKLRNV